MATKGNVIIIGGTSGLGLTAGITLSKKGYEVIIAGRSEPRINKSLSYKHIDVTNEISIKDFFNSLDISQMDSLIYSAGITTKKKSIEHFDQEEYRKINDVNLVGAFLTLKYAYKHLKKNRGRVVIVNSLASRTFSQFSGFEYTATKSGLSGMVKQLSVEWAKDNILINSIFPSMIDTPMLRENLSEEEIISINDSIPLGRVAKVEEIIHSIEFLINKKNTYITGSGIDICGGKYLSS